MSEERLESFDLALASDVVYEAHHALLLPLVMQRWLKPGGRWAVALAIRDADMCDQFLQQMEHCNMLALELLGARIAGP